jgi:hypothetical protein
MYNINLSLNRRCTCTKEVRLLVATITTRSITIATTTRVITTIVTIHTTVTVLITLTTLGITYNLLLISNKTT